MEMCFLGHQTWMVRSQYAQIIVDPVLKDSFGINGQFGVQVYPPRNIDSRALQSLDAIILSHEHSDHFDLPSLECLPRVPVYVGSTVVKPISDSIERLGFPVIRVCDTNPIKFSDLSFRLFPSHPKTAYWESRVHQVFFEELGSDCKFLIGVDALISEKFIKSIDDQKIPAPNVIAVSNNSQITPVGVTGALQSISGEESESKDKLGLVGIKLLRSLTSYIEKLPPPEEVLICGGGFMKNYDNFGPFPLSDQDKIGEILNKLSVGIRTKGLIPGESLNSVGNSIYQVKKLEWITFDEERNRKLQEQREHFLLHGREVPRSALTGNFNDKNEYLTILNHITLEIEQLAPQILLSNLGRHILRKNKRNGVFLGDKRFAIVFSNCWNGDAITFTLNTHSGKFEQENLTLPEAISNYPFGLEVSLQDFYKMITGEIQIWDLAGIAMHGWYECPEFEGPVPFMYSYYGENTSPDLLKMSIEEKLISMGIN